jgi:cell division protein ZapE
MRVNPASLVGCNRPAMPNGPLSLYRSRRGTGTLKADAAQEYAAERLQSLFQALREYRPAMGRVGWRARFGLTRRPDPAPQGLYIYGDVGRGKSMLMDLFFDTAEVSRKRRIHFHAFMQEAHQRIHRWKQANPGGTDPIPPLADAIAAEAALLCFDEFQVHDITDAMILGRLFEALFARGVVMVATSNTAPSDLFRGKPGRDAFLPFIALIQARVEVLHLEAQQDYRRERIRGLPTWHHPADGRAERALDAAFRELTGESRGTPCAIEVLGRRVDVEEAARGVARTSFEAICGRPLGPADYLALATHFHSLVLDGVPRLGPDNFDKARRFITLVDALYEHRCKLIVSAEATPDQIYERGENAAMFERTASRLNEMQSHEYLGLPHLP